MKKRYFGIFFRIDWFFKIFYIKRKLNTKLETLFSKENSDVFGKWKSKHTEFFCGVLENSNDCSNHDCALQIDIRIAYFRIII